MSLEYPGSPRIKQELYAIICVGNSNPNESLNLELILVKNHKRFEALKPDAFAVMASIECEKMDNNEAVLKLPTNDVSLCLILECFSGFLKTVKPCFMFFLSFLSAAAASVALLVIVPSSQKSVRSQSVSQKSEDSDKAA